jgi:hypothetical protein
MLIFFKKLWTISTSNAGFSVLDLCKISVGKQKNENEIKSQDTS